MLCLHHHWLPFLPLLSPLGGGAFRRPRFFRRRGSLARGGAGVLGGGGLSREPGPSPIQSGCWGGAAWSFRGAWSSWGSAAAGSKHHAPSSPGTARASRRLRACESRESAGEK